VSLINSGSLIVLPVLSCNSRIGLPLQSSKTSTNVSATTISNVVAEAVDDPMYKLLVRKKKILSRFRSFSVIAASKESLLATATGNEISSSSCSSHIVNGTGNDNVGNDNVGNDNVGNDNVGNDNVGNDNVGNDSNEEIVDSQRRNVSLSSEFNRDSVAVKNSRYDNISTSNEIFGMDDNKIEDNVLATVEVSNVHDKTGLVSFKYSCYKKDNCLS
jgi:hypothetical protein